MDFLDAFNVSASGLTAERTRLHTVSSNLANARTTRTAEGGPYQRKSPVFEAVPVDPFGDALDRAVAGVRVADIQSQPGEGARVHDPSHPDADAEGFVTMPDIDILQEMVDLMGASRAYEANLNALSATRDMALHALEIGGGR